MVISFPVELGTEGEDGINRYFFGAFKIVKVST